MTSKDLRHPAPDANMPAKRDRAGLSRRSFLRTATVAAGTAGFVAHSGAAARASELAAGFNPEELAREHADDPAVLLDLTRCVGCAKCVRACKLDNELEWRQDQPSTGPEATLASSNWTVVRPTRVGIMEETPLGPRRRETMRYTKVQCMHCLEPACASACFVAALQKSEAGPVTYDPSRCIGCRYCMVACPFGVPAFDWESTLGRIEKCDLCSERTSDGEPTACAEACPTGAISFGRRGDLLAEAWRRIDQDGSYVRHVYGEHEVGGTSVMYISDVPFEELGFPTALPDEPLPVYTWRITRLIPPVAAGIVASLATLYARRRRYLLDAEDDETRGAEEQPAGVSP